MCVFPLHFTLSVDSVSIVFLYNGFRITEEPIIDEEPVEDDIDIPFELDFPTHGSLYVIQETMDYRLFFMELQCYNLEGNDLNDTELIFTNTNLTEISNNVRSRSDLASVSFRQFPPSFNGNVTCRSRVTGRESTVFIASKQHVICT